MIFETEFYIYLDDEIFQPDFNAGSKENLPKVFRMYFDNYLKGNPKPTATVLEEVEMKSENDKTDGNVEGEKVDGEEEEVE